jgi:hypothetical protein
MNAPYHSHNYPAKIKRLGRVACGGQVCCGVSFFVAYYVFFLLVLAL